MALGIVARVYGCHHVHIFLQFRVGIVRLDARLQGTCARIQAMRRHKRYARGRLQDRHPFELRPNLPHVRREILLIDIDQHPDRADVGDHETLRGAWLNELSGRHILLDDQAADGRPRRELRKKAGLSGVRRDQ